MIRGLNFFNQLPEGFSIQQLGSRLFESLSDVDRQQQTIAQQTNTNSTGQPLPPPAIDSLTVTGQNGHFHLQIQHQAEFYRDIQYHAEYADNPSFQNPQPVDMGASRGHTMFLGNGTYYWRAFAAYASSDAGPAAYHGGAHSPQPVSGGGSIGGPAFLPPQGSGTGAPGEGLSGPGPIAFRTSTGRPPIRGQLFASGGSSGGSLAPSPMTGLPEGMASLGGSGGSPSVSQLVTVTQSQLAALAATLNTGSAGLRAYVSDYDHTLVWTGMAWTFASGERSGFVEGYLVDPSPGTGWNLCDGSTVTYLKADGTTGSITLPDWNGNPSYPKYGAAVTGINAPTAPTLTMNSYTPAGTISTPAFTGTPATPAGTVSTPTFTGTPGTTSVESADLASVSVVGVASAAAQNHTHNITPAGTVSTPTFAGTPATPAGTVSTPTFSGTPAVLTGTISTTGQPQNTALRAWFRR